MAELRWILILLGLLLIAAVYLLGRRRSRPPVRRFEPRLSDEAGSATDDTAGRDDRYAEHGAEDWLSEAEQTRRDDQGLEEIRATAGGEADISRDSHEAAVDEGDRKIISVRVAARSSTRFRGADVIRIMTEEGLEFGRYRIFHRTGDGSDNAVFSVASMVEPGTFDLDAIEEEQIPGVTLFMVLPGPRDGIAALDDMLDTAQRLAEQLNGEVLDQSGSTLSRQRAGNLRDEIIAFQHHFAIHQRQAPASKRRRRLL